MERWYTLHTKPNREFQVAALLQEKGLETFLPLAGDKPFFPCYLFVKVDFRRVGLSRVQWTPGLRRIVAFDGQPATVPDDVIALIRQRLPAAGDVPPLPALQPGDPVRITEGPFRDMEAIFEGPVSPARRVHVLLTVLGRVNRVQIPAQNLERLPRAPEAAPRKRPRRTRGRGRVIRSASAPAMP
ncbi:MAG: hypothetical protein D6796_03420 [Caldilineae bacterium]|nr:MAG: hypothetical protein D6796_03420 [Caldilineae bacterium]